MNFSDFSFWWVLLIVGIPFFSIRFIAKSLNLWRDFFDSLGLLGLSLILFVNASRSSFIIFICELIFNYLMVSWMLRRQGWQAKLIATVLIVINIAILAYFKYFVFFVEDVIGLLINIPPNWQESSIVPVKTRIPPGLSFYTFQMVAFVVDSLNARKKKPIAFIDYMNFVSFFPQIVAGPIERRQDLFPQIEAFKFKFTVDNFEKGLRWLSLGFFMKFVLGDNLAPYIDLTIATNAWQVWFFALLFTLRIYFDFAGYSFIAMGLGYFLGVKLTVNFLAPYTSQSINEFWRRWHITLSTWFRDYVFLPLMGSNKQWAAFYLFLTFTLSGFWHGAAWNFIIWGAYHGALLLILRYLGRPFYGFVGQYIPRPQIISWGLTFGSVIFGCLFFMETNSHRLFTKLQTLLTPSAYSLSNLQGIFGSYSNNETVALILILGLSTFILFMEHLAVWQNKFEYELLLSRWLSPILLALTIILAANTPSEFIYFEF
ncbi:membrane bound O-acyl transferase MBOAT family protein [Rippkaea orientalis PCC 8801]|uniref:Membrane bound O-acyl transferase MBOAT family protein n=1 Tax=Rippkaea orientalis (strain PCC 8801 / RF-1) TaxID=41431 RepID=B7JZH7_RIPO1|nr:MBOAT family O-acyltransferase [Rippkaea orientalis]ACK64137.1 membrane bound O-acyl transferase MBOAT family protein [Rippkaea orientalis PCC 8801]